jgi:hypothetical protein
MMVCPLTFFINGPDISLTFDRERNVSAIQRYVHFVTLYITTCLNSTYMFHVQTYELQEGLQKLMTVKW